MGDDGRVFRFEAGALFVNDHLSGVDHTVEVDQLLRGVDAVNRLVHDTKLLGLRV